MEHIPDMLERLKSDLGCETQAELARALDVEASTVSKWLSGAITPRKRSLARSIRNLQLDPADYGLAEPGPARRTSSAHITDEPPAWAREMLDELHALRSEVQDCHRRMEKDAS
jgi:transcriptional regulator with XRE-family HTH domain